METNNLDRLETFLDDLQHDQRPRVDSNESDGDLAEAMAAARLLKSLASQSELRPEFDAALKQRLLEGEDLTRPQETEGADEAEDRPVAGHGGFGMFRWSFGMAALGVVLVVGGTVLMLRQPNGSPSFVARVFSPSLSEFNDSGLNANQSEQKAEQKELSVEPKENAAPKDQMPLPSNKEGTPTPGTQTPEPSTPPDANEPRQNVEQPDDGEGDPPVEGEPTSGKEPTIRVAIDFPSLAAQQQELLSAIELVDQDFTDSETLAQPALFDITEDLNQLE